MVIDTHAHLADDKLINLLPKIIKDANSAGVDSIISVGCSLAEAAKSIEITEKYSCVFATTGLYPHDNGDESEQLLSMDERLLEVEKLAKHKKVVAIGECGLDYSIPPPWEKNRTHEEQQVLFRKQIDIARRLRIPLIIHSRKAKSDTLKILLEEKNNGYFDAVWHCYTENLETAKILVEHDFMLSFTGILTYPSGKDLIEVVENIPIESIMVETDSPYLPPHSARSSGISVNEPKYVTMIAKKIAEIKGETYEDIARVTTKNAISFFKL